MMRFRADGYADMRGLTCLEAGFTDIFCLHRWSCSLSRIEGRAQLSLGRLITSSSSDLAPGKLLVSILLSGLVGLVALVALFSPCEANFLF